MTDRKIMVVALGSFGDVLPSIDFCQKLRGQGFECCLVGYSVFKELVESFNVEFLAVCDEKQYQSMVSLKGELLNYEANLHHFEVCSQFSIEPLFRFISSNAEKYELFVFTLSYCDGAVWACQSLNIPMAMLSFSPFDVVDKVKVSDDAKFEYVLRKIKSIKNKYRIKLGLSVYEGEIPAPEYLATICFYPPELCTGVKLLDKKGKLIFLGFPEKGEQWSIGSEQNAEIVYTTGTAFSATEKEYESFEYICRQLGLVGLFLSPNISRSITENGIAKVPNFVNLRSAIKNATLVIHHGGIGTISDSFEAKMPQIIIPRAFDQFYNAALIQNLGLGESIAISSWAQGREGATSILKACRKWMEKLDEVSKRLSEFAQKTTSNELLEVTSLIMKS